ncbi:hypothetical protein [Streptomyces sp. NPDC058989]|uniref:hypothetical protein n=1 Tax=Streptomyces sp. NPDC058989 TaxID=3346686 RepID=UPI0036A350EB
MKAIRSAIGAGRAHVAQQDRCEDQEQGEDGQVDQEGRAPPEPFEQESPVEGLVSRGSPGRPGLTDAQFAVPEREVAKGLACAVGCACVVGFRG